MGVMRQNAAWIVIVVVVVEDVMSGCREACTELHGGRGKALGAKRTRGSLTRCWDGAWPTQVCVCRYFTSIVRHLLCLPKETSVCQIEEKTA